MSAKLNIQRVPLAEFPYPGLSALRYETDRDEALDSSGKTQVIQKVTDYHITVYRDEEVLAWVTFCGKDGTHLHVRNRYMKEEEACSELEIHLLTYIESWARTQGFLTMVVHANTQCQGFYRSHGFIPVGEEFSEGGILHRKMQKPIYLH